MNQVGCHYKAMKRLEVFLPMSFMLVHHQTHNAYLLGLQACYSCVHSIQSECKTRTCMPSVSSCSLLSVCVSIVHPVHPISLTIVSDVDA